MRPNPWPGNIKTLNEAMTNWDGDNVAACGEPYHPERYEHNKVVGLGGSHYTGAILRALQPTRRIIEAMWAMCETRRIQERGYRRRGQEKEEFLSIPYNILSIVNPLLILFRI